MKTYEYKTIGPHQNIGGAQIQCTGGCQGKGSIPLSTGSIKCELCGGTGKIDGLLKQLNDAGAEGWHVVSHQFGLGHGGQNHIFVVEREVEAAEAAK